MVAIVSTNVLETVFDFTWEQMVTAYWNRHSNPYNTQVITEDTIKREVRDGKLYTRRLLSKMNPVSKYCQSFYKPMPVCILEDSIVDPKKRTLTTYTRKIGIGRIMKVDEIVVYKEREDGCTLVVRQAFVSSFILGFSRAIHVFGTTRFKLNSNNATNGFNYVLHKMFPKHLADNDCHTQTTSTSIEQHSAGAVAELTINNNNNNSDTNNDVKDKINNSKITSDSNIHKDNNSFSLDNLNQNDKNLYKTENFRSANKSCYEFFKCSANKIARLFSMQN